MSYIIIYFVIKYNIYYLIGIYSIIIVILSYKGIKKNIREYKIAKKYTNTMTSENPYESDNIFKYKKEDRIYDELMETNYILKNCDIEEDYNLYKIS
jgi:hypothetical protein